MVHLFPIFSVLNSYMGNLLQGNIIPRGCHLWQEGINTGQSAHSGPTVKLLDCWQNQVCGVCVCVCVCVGGGEILKLGRVTQFIYFTQNIDPYIKTWCYKHANLNCIMNIFEGTPSSQSDTDHYIIIRVLLYFIWNKRWEPKSPHWRSFFFRKVGRTRYGIPSKMFRTVTIYGNCLITEGPTFVPWV
jgi:hypothetical protein